jgi:glycerol kinase
MDDFAKGWAVERQFNAAMGNDQREASYARWKRAVSAVLGV